MAFEIRRIGVILAVAVLFAIFIFSVANAFTVEEVFPDGCSQKNDHRAYIQPIDKDVCEPLPAPTQAQEDACEGNLHPDYSTGGCPASYTCDCYEIQQQFNERNDQVQFWIAIILGFIGIAVGMLLPQKNEVNEWIGGGFIIGGLIAIFIATAQFWSNIDKIIRPIVIALELGLVLWLAYRRLTPKKKKKK